jgi:hypothetical protein
MVLALDSISKRYGMLPSQAINEATTFDLFILDAAMSYENLVNARANGKQDVASQFDTKDLVEAVKKVRTNESKS